MTVGSMNTTRASNSLKNNSMTQSEALTIMQSGANVFLTGEPGAGKSYTVNQFTEWCRQNRKSFAITASTGIAASHIGGTTIHSWSGIKMKRKIDENNIDNFDDFTVRRIQSTKVLIIDEVSMLDAGFITMLDQIFSHYKDGTLAFGGMQMIFVGDFFQLPPVTKGSRPRFAFESDSWSRASLKVCYLTEQHRQSDPEFLDLLGSMRRGQILPKHRELLVPSFRENAPVTKLYTHNVDVDQENETELAKLPGVAHTYYMILTGHPVAADILAHQLITPQVLLLKEGARVMFTWNDKEGRFVNGTIGILEEFIGGEPWVRTVDGNYISPKKQEWRTEENGTTRATAVQYPLRLAWAITVHKSQGMTLDEAVIDLSKCFEYGQGYVAISRVRSLKGLHVIGINDHAFAMSPKVMKHDRIMRAKV